MADLVRLAFEDVAYSDGTEPAIVDRLRADGMLALSILAESGGSILGHVAFSAVTIEDAAGPWFGLGPISVHPDRQREGIGSELVASGLDRLRASGAAGCALVGDPANFASFGFLSDGRLTYPGIDPSYVQRIVFYGDAPEGRLTFAAAFTPA
ncbi:N-acetyltransferase [Fulvimarina endophytica]|uniref:N-acetyltransferase n=1 Tax=Fulvimarina endophytica TaxID=2293836 RepID=A0A371XAZ7_9HYPH|nr:N-acetyltransferase [Fulvimarina endophytica]RFC66390.1 N-acetyltransferase [Fulvimarina endophytica]